MDRWSDALLSSFLSLVFYGSPLLSHILHSAPGFSTGAAAVLFFLSLFVFRMLFVVLTPLARCLCRALACTCTFVCYGTNRRVCYAFCQT